MQANNKSDVAQVYENAVKGGKWGVKDAFKFILRPITIFIYRYFAEGIRAVQKDGPTKELEKIPNLSYEETVKVMEKCQSDGIRIVAAERGLSAQDHDFGKKKSLFQQRRITRDKRRIKRLSNLKEKYPNLTKYLLIDNLIKRAQKRHELQVQQHKNRLYNIYFNKSKVGYMGDRIADIIEYRTGVSQKLFDKDTHEAIEEIKKSGMGFNTQQLKDLSDKFKLHENGSVDIQDFRHDYCIHEIPFSAFIKIQDDLDATDIPYGLKISDGKTAQIYFENKHLQRYSELGFNTTGQIQVHGLDTKDMEWEVNTKDDLLTFKTKTGDEETKTYTILAGKNYIMKREENECTWTVFKNDIQDIAEIQKKRDVVNEELEEMNIFVDTNKDFNEFMEEQMKELSKSVKIDIEKEVDSP